MAKVALFALLLTLIPSVSAFAGAVDWDEWHAGMVSSHAHQDVPGSPGHSQEHGTAQKCFGNACHFYVVSPAGTIKLGDEVFAVSVEHHDPLVSNPQAPPRRPPRAIA